VSASWGYIRNDHAEIERRLEERRCTRSVQKTSSLVLVSLAAFCVGVAVAPLIIVALRYLP
jgi:predicted PurR-regulated permease PerM